MAAKGYLYVLSNRYLEENNRYSIGYSRNVHKKLELINATRHFSEYLYIKLLYASDDVKKLEEEIYTKLEQYKENGSFFKCNLDIIKACFSTEQQEQHFSQPEVQSTSISELRQELRDTKNKLKLALKDRAPLPTSLEFNERFMILKRNDKDYPYYTIRAQTSNAEVAFKKQKEQYTHVTILLDIPLHPNSKSLFRRAKKELKSLGVKIHICSISLENSRITEEQLISILKKTNDEKNEIVD